MFIWPAVSIFEMLLDSTAYLKLSTGTPRIAPFMMDGAKKNNSWLALANICFGVSQI